MNLICAHHPFSSQDSQDKSSNSIVSPCPNSVENWLKKSAGGIREEDYPVHWFKFISSMSSNTGKTGLSIPEPTHVHVVYSALASMNHQWTINLHDGYLPLMCSMFHFGVDYLYPTKEPQHDLQSLAPPKGGMVSSFSLF